MGGNAAQRGLIELSELRGGNRWPRAIAPAGIVDREDDSKNATPILPSSPVPAREAEHRQRERGQTLYETLCAIRGTRQSILRRSGGPLLPSRSPRAARDWHSSPLTLPPWAGRRALTRCRDHGRRVAGQSALHRHARRVRRLLLEPWPPQLSRRCEFDRASTRRH